MASLCFRSLLPVATLAFSLLCLILDVDGFSAINNVDSIPRRRPSLEIPQDEQSKTSKSSSSSQLSKLSQLMEMQKYHQSAAATFQSSKFNPHPFFTNCHVQTISGVFLRKYRSCSYISDSGVSGISKVLGAMIAGLDLDASSSSSLEQSAESEDKSTNFWDERQRITTSCERDFFMADIKYAGEKKTTYQSFDSKGLVILIHGLESNSNSSLSVDMGTAYSDYGFDVVCLNFRGCSGEPNDTLGGYHLGFTEDLIHFLELMREAWDVSPMLEKRPIYLSGFSLGANVVIKCLGELGVQALDTYNIHGAAVTGAPFDAERNIRFLDAEGFNRVVYSGNFLKKMKQRAQYQLDTHCEGDVSTSMFDYSRAMSADTVAQFENAFLARIYGFEDNVDYYRKTSCIYFLPDVAVPLLIINAGDDPFFDPDFFPLELSVDGGGNAPIKMERTKHGGHLGFMFHQLSDDEKKERRTSSWLPTELARFVSHVHDFDYEINELDSKWNYL